MVSRPSTYRQELIEDARNPKHFGKFRSADHILEATNPTCGDEIAIYVRIRNKELGMRGSVGEARFDGRGCMVMMASASRMLEHIQGKPLECLKKMTEDDALKVFGAPVTPGRLSCALLPFEAIKKLQANDKIQNLKSK